MGSNIYLKLYFQIPLAFVLPLMCVRVDADRLGPALLWIEASV